MTHPDSNSGAHIAYNPSIDGLRAFAVILVVFFHTRAGFLGGFIGVDVFFVISGFLITSILRAEVSATGQVALLRFYWNRALRLYPPLIMMLLAWAVLMPIQYPDLDVLRNGAIALFYLSDYFVAFGRVAGHLGHTWSLAVEEHFYMIWPLVLLATRKVSDRRLFLGFLLFFLLATTWRVVDFWVWESWQRTYHRFDTRMAGLALGAAIAVRPKSPGSPSAGQWAPFAILGILVFAYSLRWGQLLTLSLGIALTQILSAYVLIAMQNQSLLISRLFAAPPLVYIGLLSYSIYLWHFPMSKVLLQYIRPEATFALVLPASVVIAAVSFHLVERPLKEFRRSRGRARNIPAESRTPAR